TAVDRDSDRHLGEVHRAGGRKRGRLRRLDARLVVRVQRQGVREQFVLTHTLGEHEWTDVDVWVLLVARGREWVRLHRFDGRQPARVFGAEGSLTASVTVVARDFLGNPTRGGSMNSTAKVATWVLLAVWAVFGIAFFVKYHEFVKYPLAHPN